MSVEAVAIRMKATVRSIKFLRPSISRKTNTAHSEETSLAEGVGGTKSEDPHALRAGRR